MRKNLFKAMMVLLICSLMVGFAFTKSRTVVVKNKDEKLSIHMTGDSGLWSTQIILYINEQEIAKGETTQLKPIANLTGSYKDMKVDADCKSVATGNMLSRNCIIYIDNEKVAEVQF